MLDVNTARRYQILCRNTHALSGVSRRLWLLVLASWFPVWDLSLPSKHNNRSLYPWFFITACFALSLKVQAWASCFVHFFFCVSSVALSVRHALLLNLTNPRLHLDIECVPSNGTHLFFPLISLSMFYLILCLVIFSWQSLTPMNLRADQPPENSIINF